MRDRAPISWLRAKRAAREPPGEGAAARVARRAARGVGGDKAGARHAAMRARARSRVGSPIKLKKLRFTAKSHAISRKIGLGGRAVGRRERGEGDERLEHDVRVVCDKLLAY